MEERKYVELVIVFVLLEHGFEVFARLFEALLHTPSHRRAKCTKEESECRGGGREGAREGAREGRREEGREGGREGAREGRRRRKRRRR